jgi:hypothetical protein
MQASSIARHAVITIAILAVFFSLALPGIPRLPFFYDEADYVYASHQGWFSNWIDRPGLNIVQFARLGISSGGDIHNRQELSTIIRSSGDIHFYRHWHGPLFYQWLGMLGHWTSEEYELRLLSMLIPAAGAVLVYFGCLWVIPSSQLIAILSAAFYATGYSVIGSPELAPHQLFVVISLANLFCVAKFETTHELKFWWWSCVWAGISFVTLEVAFVNVATVLFFAWRRMNVLRPATRLWFRSVCLFLAPSIIFWPAAIFKLEPLRSYIFMAYLAVVRKGAWGNTTVFQTWESRLRSEPAEWFFITAALIIWWFLPRKTEKYAALPFFFYGLLMLVVMFKVNAVMPHYALPYLAPLTVFAGMTLGGVLQNWPKKAQQVMTAAMILLVTGGTYRFVHNHLPATNSRTKQMIDVMRSRPLDGKTLLAPQGDVTVLHYYFPLVKLELYLDEEGQRRAITNRHIDAIASDEEPFRIEYLADRSQ